MNKLSIVVPVYNEEKNIGEFLNRTISTIDKLNCDYEIIFALDTSKDNTRNIIFSVSCDDGYSFANHSF